MPPPERPPHGAIIRDLASILDSNQFAHEPRPDFIAAIVSRLAEAVEHPDVIAIPGTGARHGAILQGVECPQLPSTLRPLGPLAECSIEHVVPTTATGRRRARVLHHAFQIRRDGSARTDATIDRHGIDSRFARIIDPRVRVEHLRRASIQSWRRFATGCQCQCHQWQCEHGQCERNDAAGLHGTTTEVGIVRPPRRSHGTTAQNAPYGGASEAENSISMASGPSPGTRGPPRAWRPNGAHSAQSSGISAPP